MLPSCLQAVQHNNQPSAWPLLQNLPLTQFVGCVIHHPAVCTAIAAGVMIDDAVILNVAMPTAPFGPDPTAGKGTGAVLTGTDSTASSMSTYDCTALHTATS